VSESPSSSKTDAEIVGGDGEGDVVWAAGEIRDATGVLDDCSGVSAV